MAEFKEFKYEDILQFIIRQQGKVQKLRSFVRAFTKHQEQSIEKIVKIHGQKNQNEHLKRLSDKKVRKNIELFGVHLKQKQHSEQNVQFVRTKMDPWLQDHGRIFTELKQELKKLNAKKRAKSIQPLDISSFRTLLARSLADSENRYITIMQVFSRQMLKTNCEILQSLTNLMQKQKQGTVSSREQNVPSRNKIEGK